MNPNDMTPSDRQPVLYIDISNYLDTRANSGVQRVIREMLLRLLDDPSAIPFRVLWFNRVPGRFFVLTEEELRAFLESPEEYLFQGLSSMLAIDDIREGALFLDMDAVWNMPLKRGYLYRKLKANGVRIVNFMHDLIPVLKPALSHPEIIRSYLASLYSIYRYSDLVFFNSRSSERDFLTLKRKIGLNTFIPTKVTGLGSDISMGDAVDTSLPPHIEHLRTERYILFVGTLEPRKNHALLLDVYEEIVTHYPETRLVFVGKEGWNNEALLARVRAHPQLDKRFFWFTGIGDTALSHLYTHAFVVCYLSAYEGFGLPVAESLGYGNVTVTSYNSALYEAGGVYADYLFFDTYNELYGLLDMYLSNETLYREKKRSIQENYIPPVWQKAYHALFDALRQSFLPFPAFQRADSLPLFLAFEADLSLRETIAAYDRFAPFIDAYYLLSDDEALCTLLQQATPRPVYRVGGVAEAYTAAQFDTLPDLFLMVSEKSLPVRLLALSHYIGENNYLVYHTGALSAPCGEAVANNALQASLHLLERENFETLNYLAHKPQICNKTLLLECLTYFHLLQWDEVELFSLYFNYAVSNYPRYFRKLPFDTLDAPGLFSTWQPEEMPEHDMFTTSPSTEEEQSRKRLMSYRRARLLQQHAGLLCTQNGLVHRTLCFGHVSGTFYLSGFPYYMEAVAGATLFLPLSFSRWNPKVHSIEFVCRIENSRQHIPLDAGQYGYGVCCLPVETPSDAGVHTLYFDMTFNGVPVYGERTPYILKLLLKREDKSLLPASSLPEASLYMRLKNRLMENGGEKMGRALLLEEEGGLDESIFAFPSEKLLAVEDDEAFVCELYFKLLDRKADEAGLSHYLHLLRSNLMSREEVIRAIEASQECLEKKTGIVWAKTHTAISHEGNMYEKTID